MWSQGTFSAIVSKTLEVMDLETSITCEFSVEKTPYREVRWQQIPRPPIEFIKSNLSTIFKIDKLLLFVVLFIK